MESNFIIVPILDRITPILCSTPKVLVDLCSDLSNEQLHTNEGGDSWSPFNIVGHLIHGERTDWIPRAQIILSDQAHKAFEPFDRFAQSENSKGKAFEELLLEFTALRIQNLETLTTMNITEEMLKKEGIHPELGKVTLGQLLNSWAMHDMSHIAQISRVLAKQFSGDAGPWNQYISLRKK